MAMKPGDLIQFTHPGYVDYALSAARSIAATSGIFLGERPLTRDDGKVIPNFAVQLFGEATERVCDASMKCWLIPMEDN